MYEEGSISVTISMLHTVQGNERGRKTTSKRTMMTTRTRGRSGCLIGLRGNLILGSKQYDNIIIAFLSNLKLSFFYFGST